MYRLYTSISHLQLWYGSHIRVVAPIPKQEGLIRAAGLFSKQVGLIRAAGLFSKQAGTIRNADLTLYTVHL